MRFILMSCIAVLTISLLGCDIEHGHLHDTAATAPSPDPKPDHHKSID